MNSISLLKHIINGISIYINLIKYYLSFLYFEALLADKGSNFSTIVPFIINSPLSGHDCSYLYPSNLIHLISIVLPASNLSI